MTTALVAAGLQPSLIDPATAKPPKQARMADAQKSVVTVLRANVKPGSLPGAAALGLDDKPLADGRRSPVRWPQAGTATVTVPGRGEPTKVGSTVVSVTAPGDGGGYLADPMRQSKLRTGGQAPGRVGVRAYGPDVARSLGWHGTAFRLTRADGARASGSVGIRVAVSGFAQAFGADFETRLRLVAKPACALETPDAGQCGTSTPVRSHVDLTTHTLVADVPVAVARAGAEAGSAGPVFVVASASSGETGSATATKLSSSSK